MLRIRKLFRRFVSDEQGVALILVAIMLPVIIGFAVLAIDMARVNNLHNDLQKGADAFALAGAAELDGNADAITRANRAIDNLIANQTDFSTLNHYTLKSTDLKVTFLKDLPASDSTALDKDGKESVGTDHSTTDPTLARFVEITMNPANFSTIFPASFIGGPDSFQVSTQAVAGYGSAVCDFTPMFICNPYEPDPTNGYNPDVTLEEAAAQLKYRRREIVLRSGPGAGSQYFPGNFGFLDSPVASNGAKGLAQMLGSAKPPACYSIRGVTTKTGETTGPVQAAINTRFGVDEPASGANLSGPEYGPGINVRKGLAPNGNSCPKNPKDSDYNSPAASLMGLPTDETYTVTGSTTAGRVGSGDWYVSDVANGHRGLSEYWTINHGSGSTPTLPAELSGTGDSAPSRYQVYRYEIDNGLVGDPSPNPSNETGTPAANCGTPIDYVDRRLLYVAVLDCVALQKEYGDNMGGHLENLPVHAFASFFLTSPVKDDGNIRAELVDVQGRVGGGTLTNFSRDEAQLYR
jgi:hypothetical protein